MQFLHNVKSIRRIKFIAANNDQINIRGYIRFLPCITQLLQPPVDGPSFISTIQSKSFHWDTKIYLPFQIPQGQNTFLLAGYISTPIIIPCLQSTVVSIK